jgi:hypothetical protein
MSTAAFAWAVVGSVFTAGVVLGIVSMLPEFRRYLNIRRM